MKRLLAYLIVVISLGLTFSVNSNAASGKGLCINGLIKGSTTANVTKLKNINKVIPGFGKCSEKEFLSKKNYPSEYKKLKKMVGVMSSSKPIPLIKILYVINNTDIFDKYNEEKNRLAELSQTQKVAKKISNKTSLTLAEEDKLKAHLFKCWSLPLGLPINEDLLVRIKLKLKPDGSIIKTEILDHSRMNKPGQAYYKVLTESVLRAIKNCQPLPVPIAGYERWKDLQLNFDAREMLEG